MAFHKTRPYPILKQKASFYARAFGHPERLEILLFLRGRPYATVSEIVERSPLSLPTVSQHLKYLRDSGLVEPIKDYPYVRYIINEPSFQHAVRNLVSVWSDIGKPDQLT